jgi:serine/threonine-protein phosphatase 2A regulatory subunit A
MLPPNNRRVRHNLAMNFAPVAFNMGYQSDRRWIHEQTLVMACYNGLLKDVEAEVRAAAVGHLAQMISYGGPTLFASHLQGLLSSLADDVVMEVRSKCALALMQAAHAKSLDDPTIVQAFGPLLESFLEDEFQEVQLQVLTHLHNIAHLLPELPGVVTALLQMSKANNWRVRQSVAQLLPHLAEARGLEFFQTVLLEPAWLSLLLDKVACVRQACVSGMPLLMQVAGPEWMHNVLLPHHIRLYQSHSHSYLIRLTLLQAHIQTALACPTTHAEILMEVVRPSVRALNDKVPNVRMVAAHGLGQVGRRLLSTEDVSLWRSEIQPAMEQVLLTETDPDCTAALQGALQQAG